MIRIQFRRVRNQELLAAILDVLQDAHGTGYEVDKPRVSGTYTLTLNGPNEDAFLRDFRRLGEAARFRFSTLIPASR